MQHDQTLKYLNPKGLLGLQVGCGRWCREQRSGGNRGDGWWKVDSAFGGPEQDSSLSRWQVCYIKKCVMLQCYEVGRVCERECGEGINHQRL